MTPIRTITGLVVCLVLLHPVPVIAQQGKVYIRLGAGGDSYDALAGTPIMVTVLRDGTIVQQSETTINNGLTWSVTPGVYDVRLEADGAVTEVKQGITVIEGQQVSLLGRMQAGEGLHIVEYATGGVTREELAVRLARLDEAMTGLKRELESVVRTLGRLEGLMKEGG